MKVYEDIWNILNKSHPPPRRERERCDFSNIFIYLHIPSYTFIYLYIPLDTFIYLQIAPYTFIYFKISDIKKMRANMIPKIGHNSSPRASLRVRL